MVPILASKTARAADREGRMKDNSAGFGVSRPTVGENREGYDIGVAP